MSSCLEANCGTLRIVTKKKLEALRFFETFENLIFKNYEISELFGNF